MMRTRIKRQCYYDARANDVNLRDITSSEKNANHLRALRDEQPNNFCRKLSLMTRDYHNSREHDFVIREGDDLGWLGYFLGNSKRIEALSIHDLPEERQLDALIEGIAHNKSIYDFHFATNNGYQSFERVDCILRSNKNISEIGFSSMTVGRKRARSIASKLRLMQHKSMKSFSFYQNNIISGEVFSWIGGALRSHPQLEELYLMRNNIGSNGCMILGNMLSSWHAPNLRYLNLEGNSIDDRGLQVLVEGMLNCSNLEELFLSGNQSITAAGFSSLSTLFQSDNCALEELYLKRMTIGDDGAAALAGALVGNKLLKHLIFDVDSSGITEVGWSAFSKLLCDTSSTNNTFLSNHTLKCIGQSDKRGTPEDVKSYLDLNSHRNKPDIAIMKVFARHLERHFNDYHDFDTESLFRWELKFLPLLVTWFERARSVFLSDASDEEDLDNVLEAVEDMKLATVYKFVRGVPLSIIDGYNSHSTITRTRFPSIFRPKRGVFKAHQAKIGRRLSHIMSRKRRLDGETK